MLIYSGACSERALLPQAISPQAEVLVAACWLLYEVAFK
jgi:hypothetical protein